MNLLDVVREVRRHLEENGRLSLRMLRRQFALDDAALEEVIEELVDVQRVARREENALAWSAAAPPVGIPPPARDPRAYTPKHLADKILQSKSALEGERKQVTVLFADVKGSMELAEQIDPEEWHRHPGSLLRDPRRRRSPLRGHDQPVSPAMGSWRCSARRSRTRITRSERATRRSHLRDDLRRYANELRRERTSTSRCEWDSTPGRSSSERSATTCAWTTRRSATRRPRPRMEQIAEPGRAVPYRAHGKARRGDVHASGCRPHDRERGEGARRRVRARGLGRLRTRLEVSRARGFSRFVGRERDGRPPKRGSGGAIAGNARSSGSSPRRGSERAGFVSSSSSAAGHKAIETRR